MKKLESIIKKAKNINVKGVLKGRHNKKTGEFDELAKERAIICAACEKCIEEPIDSLKIHDELIPEISNKCCGVCFCALPYLLRQSEESCKLKKW